jgi:cysteine-rich repeat protein
MTHAWRRHALVLAAAALATLSYSARAYAASATVVGTGAGTGITVTSHGSAWAGIILITIDGGPATNSYCVDISHQIRVNDTVPQINPQYPCEVLYILRNYFPTCQDLSCPGSAGRLPNNNDEAAAVQGAIWKFTDGVDVTSPLVIKDRSQAIIADATGECQNIAPVPQSLTLTLTPPGPINYFEIDGTNQQVVALLLDTNGHPIPNHAIHLEVTGASGSIAVDGVTNGSGQFDYNYPNPGSPGLDTITASVGFTVPVGLEFKSDDPPKQGIVLTGTPVNGTVTAQATKQWLHDSCGNGLRAPDEQCDDGNGVDGDGCDSNCTLTGCGNAILTAGEQCDDGNQVNGDGCDANCSITGCPNGIRTSGEECDDGNLTNGDGCDANCTVPRCGNQIVDAGEECDDGNLTNGDGCDANCTVSRCGNDVVDPGEQCDDGNTTSNDGCDGNCTLPGCGNGVLDAGEDCDDGNQDDLDQCANDCTSNPAIVACPAPIRPAFIKKAIFRHTPFANGLPGFDRWQLRGEFIIEDAIDPATEPVSVIFTQSPNPNDAPAFSATKDPLLVPAQQYPFHELTPNSLHWRFLDSLNADGLGWVEGKVRVVRNKVKHVLRGKAANDHTDVDLVIGGTETKMRESIVVNGRCWSIVLRCRGSAKRLRCASVTGGL